MPLPKPPKTSTQAKLKRVKASMLRIHQMRKAGILKPLKAKPLKALKPGGRAAKSAKSKPARGARPAGSEAPQKLGDLYQPMQGEPSVPVPGQEPEETSEPS